MMADAPLEFWATKDPQPRLLLPGLQRRRRRYFELDGERLNYFETAPPESDVVRTRA